MSSAFKLWSNIEYLGKEIIDVNRQTDIAPTLLSYYYHSVCVKLIFFIDEVLVSNKNSLPYLHKIHGFFLSNFEVMEKLR